LGEVITSETWQLSKGKNQIDMNLQDPKTGVYFINITGQGGQVVKRLVVE
jgi:hypothetical protein